MVISKHYRARDNVVLKPVGESDAEIADKYWPSRHDGSLFLLRRQICWNPTMGAYKKLANGEEELMGWCLTLQAGALGALQVREQYQNQGIGSMLVIAMAKLLAGKQQDTFGFVDLGNDRCLTMFEKVGFRRLGSVFWVWTHPRTMPRSDWKGDKEGDLLWTRRGGF